VLLAYGRLLLQPNALIVDRQRPWADNATAAVVPRLAENDLTRLYLPAHRRIAAAWRRDGRIPTWDPTGFGGRPIPGNPQSGLWYPPVWLIWTLDWPAAWSWATLGHLIWAGWGGWCLARTLGLASIGATVAGMAFALSPYLTAQVQAGHVPHVWSASWIGWALAALMVGLRGEQRGWWTLAATLALAGLAGHPQEAYLLTLVVAVWGCVAAWHRMDRILGVGCALLGAAALSAVGWLPVWLMLGESRTVDGVPASAAAPYTLSLRHLSQLVWPMALGGPADYRGPANYAEAQLAPGVSVLILALLGIRSERKRSRPWIALILICWLVAAGRSLGMDGPLRTILPGFNQMRVLARTLFVAGLGWAMLAGLGVAAATRGNVRWPRWNWFAAGCVAAELVALSWVVVRVSPTQERSQPDALDQAIARCRSDPRQRVRAPEHLVDAERIDRLGLEMTDLYDWFQLRRSADLYEALYAYGSPARLWTCFDPVGEGIRERFRRAVLDRMGVGLVITAAGSTAPPGAVAEQVGTIALRTPRSPLPRAYVVPNGWVAPPEGWRIALAWLDPRQSVLLEQPDPLGPGPRQPFTPAAYRATAPDCVVVDVRVAAPGLLVVTDAWSNGWRAWRNGAEVPILVGDHAHRVIALPEAGSYQVVLRYEPPGLWAGWLISLSSWIVWSGQTLARWRPPRSLAPPQQSR
jgi:hypothetical protein